MGALVDSSGNLSANPEVLYGKVGDDEVPDSQKDLVQSRPLGCIKDQALIL